MFSTEDRAAFLEAFGEDVPVKQDGVLVNTIKGIFRYEEIVSSPNEAEIGSSVLTMQIDKADFNALDKSKKYAFGYDGFQYNQRGPATDDGSGFKKLQLTKVPA